MTAPANGAAAFTLGALRDHLKPDLRELREEREDLLSRVSQIDRSIALLSEMETRLQAAGFVLHEAPEPKVKE